MSKIILNGIEYSNGITYQELQPVIYSTEEREIGCFVDGKPLYQKSINIGAVTANTVKVIDITSLNVDSVADYIATAVLTNGWKVPLPQTHTSSMSYQAFCRLSSSTQLAVGVGSSVGISDGYVTLQYTKTTDTAGSGSWTPSGANAVHYSTNEQVIGTWIDSKPLYEKTVSFGALPNSTSKSVAHGISDLDQIVDFSALAKRPSPFNIIPLPSSHYQSTSAQQEISFNATNITIRNGNNASTYTDVYVTLRYTKTTD